MGKVKSYYFCDTNISILTIASVSSSNYEHDFTVANYSKVDYTLLELQHNNIRRHFYITTLNIAYFTCNTSLSPWNKLSSFLLFIDARPLIKEN